jgi:pilus assembly protein Flp/PilA
MRRTDLNLALVPKREREQTAALILVVAVALVDPDDRVLIAQRPQKRPNCRSSQFARFVMKNFLRSRSGATAIEYGLIAGLIAVVVITAVSTVGTTLSSTFYAAMASAP